MACRPKILCRERPDGHRVDQAIGHRQHPGDRSQATAVVVAGLVVLDALHVWLQRVLVVVQAWSLFVIYTNSQSDSRPEGKDGLGTLESSGP